jgi:protein-disulfide isomerase
MWKAWGKISTVVIVVTIVILGLAGYFFWRVAGYTQAIRKGDLTALPQYASQASLLTGSAAGSTEIAKGVEDPSAPAVGPKDARLTIVEFFDFQCPYCQQTFTTVREMASKYGKSVRFELRNFPLTTIHPDAMAAAEAGSCAALQGKFWPMHDRLFAISGSTSGDLSRANIDRTALQSGLDMTAFAKCLNSHARYAQVRADMAAGTAAGVRGTPTFFFNGRRVEGVIPPDVFEQLILSLSN